MADRRLHREEDRPPLSSDQRAVFDAYFEGDPEVVCAPAGSGTGKTTTAVEVVTEAVVRELHRAPDRNPFESILVTTFTKDAARQLRGAVKARLREHRASAPDSDPVVRQWDQVVRWLETASNVRTIDSFTQDLLRELAVDAGVAPSFSVADGIRRSDLLESVFARLRSDPDLADPIARLESTFPADGDDRESWERMVERIHRNCREFCLPIEEARRELLRAVTGMHAGREPETFADVLAIVDALTDYDPEFVREAVDDPQAWADHARETYRASRRIAGDFGVVLAAFDRAYDRLSRSQGALTHTDITHVVRSFLADDPGDDGDRDAESARRRRDRFAESLAGRFRHVVVDEFQDTNYAQCRILAHLIDGARTLLIGDRKQSIYEWRSAEPRLFAEVIAYADGEAEDNVLDAESVRSVPLTENFRSHPHLVRAANYLFPRVFSDPGRGGIGTFAVDYEPLSAQRAETDPDRSHLHAIRVPDAEDDPDDDRSRRERRVEREAERVAGTLRSALTEGSLRVDREGATVATDDSEREPDPDASEDLDPIRAGDVAVLFRSRRYMRVYSRVFDRYGIDNAVLGRQSLFAEPEVGAVIDALGWVGRPNDPEAVRRLVESPVAGLSTDGIRRVARAGYDLDDAAEAWNGTDEDRRELRALLDFRDDLRGQRDGSKADLVSELLVHSGFDAAALADGDGTQRYANLRRFVEVIDGWEDEETLSYGEFMRRLTDLRSGRIDDDTSLAAVADVDSEDTVKLLTAHTAKGLEFPVVVLADTTHDERYRKVCDRPFVADRRHGLALRPTTGDSTQPDGDAFPTFDGEWFHEDDSEYDFDRGLLWVSELRGTDGRLRHDHPFGATVRDRRAEFWRLLYVAFTRAGDHLILPFHRYRSDEWTTWAGALEEHLDPGEGGIETPEGPVPVGADDVDPADPPAGVRIDLDRLLTAAGNRQGEAVESAGDPTGVNDAATERPRGGPRANRPHADDRRFRPAAVPATSVRTLLTDPPAFQRRILRGVGDADPVPVEDRGIAPAGSDPAPGDLSPTAWGRAVHRALQAVNAAADPAAAAGAPSPAVERAIADAVDDERDARLASERVVESVLPAYRETDAWEAVRDGAVRFPEYPVVAPLSAAGADLSGSFLRGRLDLLYRDDGWRICEFKTGTPPADGSLRAALHRTQLEAYGWLLSTVHGIDADAGLVYLPAGESVDVEADPDRFARRLSTVGDLWVDREGILRGSGVDAA